MLPYTKPIEFYERYFQSIIYYDNAPVYVTDVDPPGRRDDHDRVFKEIILYVIPLPYSHTFDSRPSRFSAFDDKFSDTPIHLGYANSFKVNNSRFDEDYRRGYYLSRIPVRQSKQGLHSSAIWLPPNGGYSFSDLLYSQPFVDMLRKNYKPFQEIKEVLLKNRSSYGPIAFDPQLALEFNTLDQWILYYKNSAVAHSFDGDKFILAQSKLWLTESLEEKGLQVTSA